MVFELSVTEDSWKIHIGIDASVIALLVNLLGLAAPALVHFVNWLLSLFGG